MKEEGMIFLLEKQTCFSFYYIQKEFFFGSISSSAAVFFLKYLLNLKLTYNLYKCKNHTKKLRILS